jgi:hypothetical protein
LCARWREHVSFVTPETVVRWHRQGWRLFWRGKSRSRGGRPHLTPVLGTKPRYLLRHRDAVFGREFRKRTRRIGIDAVPTPIHAPKANAIAERSSGH